MEVNPAVGHIFRNVMTAVKGDGALRAGRVTEGACVRLQSAPMPEFTLSGDTLFLQRRQVATDAHVPHRGRRGGHGFCNMA